MKEKTAKVMTAIGRVVTDPAVIRNAAEAYASILDAIAGEKGGKKAGATHNPDDRVLEEIDKGNNPGNS